MAMKMSDALIGITLVCGIITLYVMLLADGSAQYNTSFNGAEYAEFNATLQNVNSLSADQTARYNNLTSSSGFDWLGGLFTSAWGAFKTTGQSVQLIGSLGQYSLENEALGLTHAQASFIKNILLAIVGIIVTFIIVRMIFKEQV